LARLLILIHLEFEPIGSGHKGDSQVFAVSVVDNDQVETVNLYFRFSEQDPYRSKKMELLGSSGIYSVKLEAKDLPIDATFIQYYLEATDTAGNRALQGFAFDPIERTLVDATQLTEATAESPAEAGGLSFGQKLLYGVAAVLVVGAIASASGGGGVSSAPGVPVTIVVDQLP